MPPLCSVAHSDQDALPHVVLDARRVRAQQVPGEDRHGELHHADQGGDVPGVGDVEAEAPAGGDTKQKGDVDPNTVYLAMPLTGEYRVIIVPEARQAVVVM